jgi:[ribosomal protein S5]-alanine N-acetyltransferase
MKRVIKDYKIAYPRGLVTKKRVRKINIELVPYRTEYLKDYFAYRNQPSTLKHNPVKDLSIEEIGKMLPSENSNLSNLDACKNYRWFISTKSDIVGQVVITGINLMMNYAEIGYGIYEKFQNRGYATVAVKKVVEKVFKETPLRKIIAYVHDKNVPSNKLLVRIGFKKEGLLREHYIINGNPENEAVYGLLRSDLSV